MPNDNTTEDRIVEGVEVQKGERPIALSLTWRKPNGRKCQTFRYLLTIEQAKAIKDSLSSI